MDHVKLKTEVIMLKNAALNYHLKYYYNKKKCNNILQYYYFYFIFDQVNAALASIRDFFRKH